LVFERSSRKALKKSIFNVKNKNLDLDPDPDSPKLDPDSKNTRIGKSDPQLNDIIVDPDPTVQSQKIKLGNI
jgi:hypothetical protein